jgi:putative addiction module component (TIGR02574 family)
MSPTISAVLDAALALPEPDRAELVELISASLASEGPLHPAWGPELRRRALEIDSGAVMPIPWAEVRRQAEAELGPNNG